MHPAKVSSILAMDGAERYGYFVRKVADFDQVWGLFADGWAAAKDSNGQLALAVWPEREFAQMCATAEWQQYVPRALTLHEFIATLIPAASAIVIFPTPSDVGVSVTPERLATDLRNEERQYSDE